MEQGEKKRPASLYLQVECPKQKGYKSVLPSIPTTNCPLFLINCEFLPFLSSTLNLSQYPSQRLSSILSYVLFKAIQKKKAMKQERLCKYLLVYTSHSPFHHSINMESTSSRENFKRKVREGCGAPQSLWSRRYAQSRQAQTYSAPPNLLNLHSLTPLSSDIHYPILLTVQQKHHR